LEVAAHALAHVLLGLSNVSDMIYIKIDEQLICVRDDPTFGTWQIHSSECEFLICMKNW